MFESTWKKNLHVALLLSVALTLGTIAANGIGEPSIESQNAEELSVRNDPLFGIESPSLTAGPPTDTENRE